MSPYLHLFFLSLLHTSFIVAEKEAPGNYDTASVNRFFRNTGAAQLEADSNFRGVDLELEETYPELEGKDPELEGTNPELGGANPELEGTNPELEDTDLELEDEDPKFGEDSCRGSEHDTEFANQLGNTYALVIGGIVPDEDVALSFHEQIKVNI